MSVIVCLGGRGEVVALFLMSFRGESFTAAIPFASPCAGSALESLLLDKHQMRIVFTWGLSLRQIVFHGLPSSPASDLHIIPGCLVWFLFFTAGLR